MRRGAVLLVGAVATVAWCLLPTTGATASAVSTRGSDAGASTAVATPASAGTAPATDPASDPPSDPDSVAADVGGVDAELAGGRRPYPGDPDKEAAIVAGEDLRLAEARTVASVSRWTSKPLTSPYRLTTGTAYTLVLTERRAAYTLTDLLVLAPQTFVRQTDGTYLLSENIVLQSGAILRLSAPEKLTIRMASDEKGFVSIIDYGGRLEVVGTEDKPVVITSWDRDRGRTDTTTTDGRAYLRAIGGQVSMQHVDLTDLGFWSGRTGGLALTGTDRPTPGALNDLGRQLTVQQEKEAAAARDANPLAERPDSTGGVTLDKVLPAGALPLPLVDIANPQYSYVSASFTDVDVTGAAYGLFIAGANGVDIRQSSFRDSLVDGIVLHRYVKNAVIERTSSVGNAGDGVVLARASTGTVLSEVESRDNERNGITISGLPLATGPNATGTPTGDYGNNTVSNSTSSGNGRYGIEVIGGHSISINANRVADNDMGIVGRSGTRQLSVVGNVLDAQRRQGISVRDGVTQAVVSGNIVTGGNTGVYVRDSAVDVSRNTLTGSDTHGISAVGSVTGSVFEQNTISGRGPSALDSARAPDLRLTAFANNTSGWEDTTPWLVTLKRLAQPLTLLWVTLGLVVLVTAIRGVRQRRRGVRRGPYGDRVPLHRPSDIVYAPPPVLTGESP